jgi:hypothetical protein
MKDRQLKPERGTATGRAALDGQIVHIPDVFEDPQSPGRACSVDGGCATKERSDAPQAAFVRHGSRKLR